MAAAICFSIASDLSSATIFPTSLMPTVFLLESRGAAASALKKRFSAELGRESRPIAVNVPPGRLTWVSLTFEIVRTRSTATSPQSYSSRIRAWVCWVFIQPPNSTMWFELLSASPGKKSSTRMTVVIIVGLEGGEIRRGPARGGETPRP